MTNPFFAVEQNEHLSGQILFHPKTNAGDFGGYFTHIPSAKGKAPWWRRFLFRKPNAARFVFVILNWLWEMIRGGAKNEFCDAVLVTLPSLSDAF